jgi:hypothetical protein
VTTAADGAPTVTVQMAAQAVTFVPPGADPGATVGVAVPAGDAAPAADGGEQ